MSEHFNRTITVKIDISNHQTETPAALAQKKAQDRQTEAEKRMMNDRQVQRIMQTFDATLVKESIVPHDEGA